MKGGGGMSTSIDSLSIEITASAKSANDSLGKLSDTLERLSGSLKSVNIDGFSQGVKNISAAMQGLKDIKMPSYNTLAKGIEKIGSIDSAKIQQAGTAIGKLSLSLQKLDDINVSDNSKQIAELAKGISQLGYKSSTQAIDNIPKLATAMKDLMSTLSKTPKVSQNLIDMTNALANLAAQGAGIGIASNSLVNGLNNVSNASIRARKSTFSLASAFGKFYASYFLVIRGIKSLWSSIESTSDYLEAYNFFDVSLTKIGKDWAQQFEKYGYESAEAYAESFKARLNDDLKKLSGVQIEIDAEGKGLLSETGLKNLGLDIEEVTQYMAQLASVINSVGQTGETSLAAASAFSKLAGDISSLFNVDYSTVASNLQSGLIGQSRALYKYGIDITNATLQTYAYELGLSKTVTEMTQAEKMQLRMIAILDQSRVSWGDLANTINQPANAIRVFKNQLSELAQVIGQLFIPLVSKIVPVLSGITIAIKRLASTIAGFFGIKLEIADASQSFYDIEEDVYDVEDAVDSTTDSVKKLKKQLAGFDKLNVLTTSQTSGANNGTGTSGGGAIDLTDEILKATQEYENAWNEAYAQMEDRVNQFADKVEKALEPVKQLFYDISIGDWFAVGEDTSNLVSGIFNFFADAIAKVDWQTLGNNIGLFFAGINWTEVFGSAGKLIWESLNGTIELWKGSFNVAPFETVFLTILALPTIVSFGSKILGLIINPFKNIIDLLFPIITTISNPIIEMFELWKGGAGTLGESFTAVFGTGGVIVIALTGLAVGLKLAYDKNEEVRESFEKATETISQGFTPLMELISNEILPDLQGAWNRLLDIFKPFGDFLGTVFVSIWQDMLNPALTYLGETVLPILTDTLSNLWNNVFVPIGKFISSVFTPIVKVLSDGLTILWENVIVPLANALGNILGKAFEGIFSILNKTIIPIVKSVINVFQFLWNNVLAPIGNFILNIFKPVFENAFKTIGGLIDGLSKSFGGLIDFIAGVFTLDWEKAWNGVKDVFKGIFNGLVSIVEGVINSIIVNGINKFLKGFDGVVSKIGSVIGLDISIPQIKKVSIPRYAAGGFPEDGWFRASKGEYFGKFDDGTSVIANNNQIISGIANGVRDANAEQNTLLREQNDLLRQLLAKDTGISSRDIFNTVRSEDNSYKRRNGHSAFAY